MRSRRETRDLHALNQDGMLICNPRDREADGASRQISVAVRCGVYVVLGLGTAISGSRAQA